MDAMVSFLEWFIYSFLSSTALWELFWGLVFVGVAIKIALFFGIHKLFLNLLKGLILAIACLLEVICLSAYFILSVAYKLIYYMHYASKLQMGFFEFFTHSQLLATSIALTVGDGTVVQLFHLSWALRILQFGKSLSRFGRQCSVRIARFFR